MELQLGQSRIRPHSAHRWVHRTERASHNPSNTGLDLAPRIDDRGGSSDDGHSHFAHSPGVPLHVAHSQDAAHLPAEIQTKAQDKLTDKLKTLFIELASKLTPR